MHEYHFDTNPQFKMYFDLVVSFFTECDTRWFGREELFAKEMIRCFRGNIEPELAAEIIKAILENKH